MPYPTEHAARVRDPGDFQPDSFRSKEITKGVRIILGRLKNETTMTTQAYRFSIDSFAADEAKKWLKDNDVKFINFEEAETKSIDEETLVASGGAVKDLGDGRVGGYLVRFTTEDEPDLEGEYFTKDTYFGETESAPVYYQHGKDPKIGKRRLGKALHRLEEFGIWAEAQLNLRDKYERFVYEMTKLGKMGWSSGTAGHLMDREQHGKAVWIKSWPLGLDDSLTPIPSDPRNIAVSIKSLQLIDMPGFPGQDGTLIERMACLDADLKELSNDVRGLVKNIDRPLSAVKRKELTELLESCSGLDAVRSDLQSVLTPAPNKLVGTRRISYELAERRKRLARILKE